MADGNGMDVASLQDQADERGRRRRRRAVRTGAVTALALVVVTVGVFSVVQTSRRITQRSNNVYALDEMVRSVTLMRAQLGFSVVILELGARAEVDVEDALVDNRADVNGAIASISLTRDAISADVRESGDEFDTTLDEFLEAASALQTEIADGTVEATTVEGFNLTYDAALSELVSSRAIALESVQDADDALGRLGTLMSFIVAFVIPSVALFVYRELTRPSRQVREFEALAVKAQATAMARRHLIGRSTQRLRALTDDPEVLREVDALDLTIKAIDRSHTAQFRNVDAGELMSELRAAVEATSSMPGGLDVSGLRGQTVRTDTRVVGAALDWLARESANQGATVMSCTVSQNGRMLELQLDDDGIGRSGALVQRLLNPASVDDRLAVESGRLDTSLLVIRQLLRSAGGDLRPASDEASAHLIVLLPLAGATPLRSGAAARDLTEVGSTP